MLGTHLLFRNDQFDWLEDYGINLMEIGESFYEVVNILAGYGIDIESWWRSFSRWL